MKRREFITLACGAAITWPLAVRAQTAKVPTVGVLLTGNPDPEIFLKGFRGALRGVGYTTGRTFGWRFVLPKAKVFSFRKKLRNWSALRLISSSPY